MCIDSTEGCDARRYPEKMYKYILLFVGCDFCHCDWCILVEMHSNHIPQKKVHSIPILILTILPFIAITSLCFSLFQRLGRGSVRRNRERYIRSSDSDRCRHIHHDINETRMGLLDSCRSSGYLHPVSHILCYCSLFSTGLFTIDDQ